MFYSSKCMIRIVRIAALILSVIFIPAACVSTVKFNSIDIGEQLLTGSLMKPEGNGPFPAIVMLHGCAGIEAVHNTWASRLKSWGYVTFIVDSFGPRGVGNVCKRGDSRVPPWMRALDARGARIYLEKLPFVDSERIVVMGWSHGGATTLKAMADTSFRAAIAFYPYCPRLQNLNAPLLILIGEKDDWTPAAECIKAVQLQKSSHEVLLKVYPGAYHSFDENGLVGGMLYFGHWLEYHPKATSDAIFQVKTFLAKHLK